MIFVLSPAKALDYESPLATPRFTQPEYLADAAELITALRELSHAQVAELMHLSDALAALNVARYAEWSQPFSPANARPAVLAFNGDVYDGLDARCLTEAQLDYAQAHLRILSGLYGLLRPLDLMQPYRLEMGTRLATPKGKNLYQFWGSQIADYLNQRAAADASPLIVNLASEEYFKSVDKKALKPRIVSCVFEEFKGDKYKVISFAAKRARGLMVRYAVAQRALSVEQLKGFDLEGYQYVPAASEPDRLVFRREPQR